MAIKGNDMLDRKVICKGYQSRICIIHRNILISLHKVFHPFETIETRWDHGYGATQNEMDGSGRSFRGKIQEAENFCKDSFGRVNLNIANLSHKRAGR
jgi:hypothetical protein